MKIGEEVYIHGYIDEIRKDVVIIRNEGGYFGTVESEILLSPSANLKTCKHWSGKGDCCLLSAPFAKLSKGKWVKITNNATNATYLCPTCGRTIEHSGSEMLVAIMFPFCHCGTDMRKETESHAE